MSILIWIIVIIYIGVGVGVMLWIKRDNEFRHSETAELLGWVSLILWPVTYLLWVSTRPAEQLEDLYSKKTYQDFKNFMKSRKKSEGDLLANLHTKQTSPDKPMELSGEGTYRDYHLEELMEQGEYMEAIRTANDMLRFAKEQQEYERAIAYEKYIIRIKEKRMREMNKDE